MKVQSVEPIGHLLVVVPSLTHIGFTLLLEVEVLLPVIFGIDERKSHDNLNRLFLYAIIF
ncbi:hypothetical protein [Virgibacillus sp. Bac332]|uniref:hypothetical protein n=1 Tax=Virgibacillus sp. Bac332 TaxID=2419842 RepID=UPI0013CF0ABE|nr:hypothetical protein [Virgibacillus sp. Bac332]QRZ16398.1 hypothetical protein JUJ52_11215 [Virgibacillus sp. AGTR]